MSRVITYRARSRIYMLVSSAVPSNFSIPDSSGFVKEWMETVKTFYKMYVIMPSGIGKHHCHMATMGPCYI